MLHAHIASMLLTSLFVLVYLTLFNFPNCYVQVGYDGLGISVSAKKIVLTEMLCMSIPDLVRQCLSDPVQHLLHLAAHPGVQSV